MRVPRVLQCACVTVGTLVALATYAQDQNVKADVNVTVGRKPGATESITVKQMDGGGREVTLTKEVVSEAPAPVRRADAAKGAAVARAGKARVIVLPAVYAKDVRSTFERELKEKWGLVDLSEVENPGYTTFLIDELVNSGSVDVLEREQLDAAVKELNFGDTDLADVGKVVRIGGMLNADYVVLPEIRYFRFLQVVKDVPYVTATTTRSLRGKLSTYVRVVDVGTSRIAASIMNDAGITNSMRRAEGAPSDPVHEAIGGIYRESARQVTAKIVAAGLTQVGK